MITILVLTPASSMPPYYHYSAYGNVHQSQLATGPYIKSNNLKVEIVFRGFKFPTSMAFLGPNDILVLEKNNGTVQRIVNGKLLSKPLLDVNVANKNERGLLGIAVAKHNNGTTFVFLYYTEAHTKDGDDITEKSSTW
jgi:aldose sugar dehydrogenase